MTWLEALWLLPLMFAVAVVLGVTGERGARAVARETRRRFVQLTLVVVLVGAVIRFLVERFV